MTDCTDIAKRDAWHPKLLVPPSFAPGSFALGCVRRHRIGAELWVHLVDHPYVARACATRLALAILPLLVLSACSSSGRAAGSFEPGEELPGGETTNTLLLGENAFIRPASNIAEENEPLFFSGNSFFNQPWVQAPASTESRDGLGPLFNARSCAACHFRDGRGRPPLEPEEPFLGLLLRLSIDGQSEHDVDQPERDVDALGHGQPIAEPSYGLQLQPFSVADVPAEARPEVHYQEIHGTYADGEPYTLLDPTYTISDLSYGPMHEDLRLSPRVAPAVVGLGLLEAIDQVALLELEDSEDVDGDGISGRANWVWDVVQQTWSLGRFGWKAEQPTVRQQSAAAFSGDIGITTTLFPAEGCTEAQPECDSALSGGAPELSDRLLLRVEVYTRLLAVPMRIRANDPEVLRGKQLFHDAQCASCHVPSYVTGADSDLAEVQNQRIWPYTDLLLHDMGEGLSDHRSSFAASGSEWRTPPLWGLGYIEVVNDHNRLLHDGRARGVSEAILWHGGEAQGSKEFFESMPAEDREALVAFINSL